MREISTTLYQIGNDTDYGIGWGYLILGSSSSILVDPGYGWHFKPLERNQEQSIQNGENGGLITPLLREFFNFVLSVEKPISHALLTHSHADHSANLSLLERRREALHLYFDKEFLNFTVWCHEKSPFQAKKTKKLKENCTESIDGVTCQFLMTPGHSDDKDDISIYLPQKKILFCGDFCQPQGREFHVSDGPSPIPFFVHGDDAIESLQRLIEIDFDIMLTAHGFQYSREEGKKALKLTQSLLRRIDELAAMLVRDHPNQALDTLAEWVYDTLTHERQFDKGKAEHRKYHYDRYGVSDFHRYDKVTIDFFLNKFRNA